jgi:hypothetical protein
METFDDGTGPALYVGGSFATAGGVASPGVARWKNGIWSAASAGLPATGTGFLFVRDLAVYHDGNAPMLLATVETSTFAGVMKFSGATWSVLGSGTQLSGIAWPSAMGVACGPGGCDLYVGGAGAEVVRYGCQAPPALVVTQPGGPGGGVHTSLLNLTPNHEYYTLFSLTPCPGGVGTGPVLGLCFGSPTELLAQVLLPPEVPPLHFIASGTSLFAGPLALAPVTIEARCVEIVNGAIGLMSPVTTVMVQ